jgi:hypothetical protein
MNNCRKWQVAVSTKLARIDDNLDDAAKGIEASKEARIKKAEADRINSERQKEKEELQRAIDDRVRLAKEVAEQLAEYHGIELEVRLEAKAKELRIPKERLRKEVTLLQDGNADAMVTTPEVEPWPEEVDADALLDELVAALRQYIVMEPHGLELLALWAVHTYCFQRWQNTPRLYISSPKKRSGKSRVLNVLDRIVAEPIRADGLSAAVVFRLTEDRTPTWLIDETDQWLDQKGELIGILNSGHAKGQKVYRCVGNEHRVQECNVFAPVAMAGIGKIKSDTLADRSIAITIRRRLETEPVKHFRRDLAEEEFEPLRRQITRWVNDWNSDGDPEIPSTINHDRMIDNWWPLLAIADGAGGDWPERAREIMLYQYRAYDAAEDDGWDILLLKDLRGIFDELGQDRIFTKEILKKLHTMTERPWPEFPIKRTGDTKPMTSRQLAHLLDPHNIKPALFKIGGQSSRGYERSDFEDTWTRYVSPPASSCKSVTPLPSAEKRGLPGNTCAEVTLPQPKPLPQNPRESADGNGVTLETPLRGAEPDEEDIEAEDRLAIQNEPPADPFDIPIPSAFDRRGDRR